MFLIPFDVAPGGHGRSTIVWFPSFYTFSKKDQSMPVPSTVQEYLRLFAPELGERILHNFPALQKAGDPLSPRLATLLRKPFRAQAVAAMGVAKKWERERSAA